MRYVSAKFLIATAGTMLVTVPMFGCGKSNSSTTSTPVTSLSGGIAKLQTKVDEETPQITGVSHTGAFLLRPEFQPSSLYASLSHFLWPSAMASGIGLSIIWDPNSGQAPTGTELTVNNLYNGGGSTSSGNECTINGVTFHCYESAKGYYGQLFNSSFTNSNGASVTPFGRLQLATQVGCIIGRLAPASQIDSDGLPVVGTTTITFPTSSADLVYQSTSQGGCGLTYNTNPSDGPSAGSILTLTVAATGGTEFAKSLSLGNGLPALYVKLDATNGVFNFMQAEDQRSSGRYAADRMIVAMSGLNGTNSTTIRMEYISMNTNNSGTTNAVSNCTLNAGSCSYEIHRIFIDEPNDAAYVMSANGTFANTSFNTGFGMQATAAGKPIELSSCSGSCSEKIALSVLPIGQYNANFGTFTAAGDYNGCVNVSDGSLATDDTLSCEVTGTTISSATAIHGIVSLYGPDPIATLLDNTSASTTLAFTGASDIYTATPSN